MPAKKPSSPAIQPPTISLDQGLDLIRDLITEGRELAQSNFTKARVDTWYTSVEEALVKTFGSDSRHIRTFWGTPEVIVNAYRLGSGRDPHAEERRVARKFSERLSSLEAIEAAAEADWRRQHLSTSKSPPAITAPITHGRTVFIVHGRDDTLRESCARFVERLGLKAAILHEQPNAGRTLIEKFEGCSDVNYAIILLTGDDIGGLASEGEAGFRARARQNVVFELGFFTGVLGRSRVCALYEPGVELPSDLSGLAYIPIDPAGAWKLQIARELKEAKLDVDMNNAI